MTPLATTVYLSHPPTPTPSHHLSSDRLPKCIKNKRCVINKLSPLIIYLDFEVTMTIHKLIKKRSYHQNCLLSDWSGLQPFSETIIADNKMAVAKHLRGWQKSKPTFFYVQQDWYTMDLIFYVRWQTTLSLTTTTFSYVVRNIVVNSISKETCSNFSYAGVFSRWADIASEWLVSPDPSWISWMISIWRSLSAMTILPFYKVMNTVLQVINT